MKKVLLALSISILSVTGLKAQLHESCGFDHAQQIAISEDPDLAKTFQINEQEIQRIISRNKNRRRSETVYTIPVVVHVIHTGEAVGVGSNISDAQINSGITQMNNAFRNTSGLSVDTKIQFQLAVKDPNCATTTGINRIDGSVLTDYATMGMERSTSNGATEAEIKALSRWSNSEYYNIWVITEIDNSNNGAGGGSFTAGFAYFPGASSAVDGTVIVHPTFGNVGTAAGGTSGTLIHELGHALNLYHVFEGDNGGASCPPAGNQCGSGQGDCCSDTSPYKRTLYNCPTGTEACTGATYDNTIKNYMDYSSDACQIMYTSEQKSRMRAALEGTRGGLLLSNALNSNAPALSVVAATCTGTSSTPHSGSGIRNVQIEGKLNVSSGSSQTDGGYTNNTSSCAGAAVLELNTQYEFNVTVQTVNTHQVKAWIDFNNDGDFVDAGEEIYFNGSIDGTSAPKDSVNFTVPLTATTDKYLRMRVVTDFSTIYGNPALTTACANVTHGETEDYLVFINNAVTPAPVAEFTASSTAICAGETVTFNDASTNSPTSWSWTTTGGNPASSTNQNQAVVYSTPGTYSVTLTATNAGGSDSEVKTNYITVSATTVGGTISSDATVCSGSNSATLTLSGHTGNIVRWESSEDNFATVTTIANTSTTQTYTNLTATTKYRAVVKSGSCAEANSAEATITVDPTTVGGTISADASVCSGANGATLTLSGHTGSVVRWESSEDNFVTVTTIANTTTTQTYTNLTATTKYRAVVKSGSCAEANSAEATITVDPTTVGGTISADASVCSGTNGATLTLSGHTGSVLRWESSEDNFATVTTITNTSTTQAYTNLTSTTKFRSVLKSGTCNEANSSEATITVNNLPAVAVNNASICAGDAAATFTATSATAISYLWSENGTGTAQTTTGTTAGNYTVQVTDGNGCNNSSTGLLTVNTLPIVSVNDATICNGDAAATFTATSDSTAANYLWSANGSGTASTTSGTTAGSYTVTVTDNNGCVGSGTGTLTVNALPVVSVNDATICDGDAAATFTATSDSVAASFLWSANGSGTSSTTSGTNAGNYTVTVTDNNGCVGSGTGTLSVNTIPSVSVDNHTICNGDAAVTFTATAPTANTFLWSANGSGTGQTTTGTTAGNYTVSVTDANGCSNTATGVLTKNALPVISVNNASICDGDGAAVFTASSDSTATAFAWSVNGTGNAQTTTGTTAGNYTVTVTDNNGCVGTGTGVLTVNSLPSVSVNSETVCAGSPAVTFTATAPAAISFVWSANGSGTASTTSGNTAGNYTVAVTDVNGCTNTGTGILTVNALPTVSVNDVSICEGDGAAVFTATSPTATTYAWSANGSGTSSTTSGTTAGDYNVVVTDNNGCTASATGILTINSLPTVNLGDDKTICTGNSATFDAENNGSTFNWSTGETTQTITTSNAGTYHVVVLDGNGCSGTDTVVLNVGASPTVNLGADTSLCAGSSLTLDAGIGFASYLWSTAVSTQTINVTTNGTYHVTVNNGPGCIGRDTIVVSFTNNPNVLLGSDTTICAGNSLTIDAGNASSHLWSTGATTKSITTSSAGTYHVTVSDINGCQGSDTINLSVENNPLVSLGADQAICSGTSMTLDAGNTGSTYVWNTGATTQTISTTTGGQLNVAVTSANGCVGNDTIIISVNASPVVNLGNDTTLCVTPGITQSVTFDAGAGFVTYLWNTGETTQSVTHHNGGVYSVTVTDENGCTGTDQALLTTNNPQVNLGADSSLCGSGSIALDAGAGFTSYVWSSGENTQGINASTSGSYSVTVMDNAGCSAKDTVEITINPAIQVFVNDTAICEGGSPAIFTATSSSTIVTYAWSGNGSGTDQTTSGSIAGSYTVIATDTKGCIDTATGQLTINNIPVVNLGGSQTSCTAVTLDAGNSGATYLWSTGATTQTVSASVGTHHVTVTDINGCIGSDTAQISNGTVTVNLGADKAICNGDIVILDAGNSGSTYVWSQPGSPSTQTLTVSTSGEYQVLVTDAQGCQGQDTVIVTVNANPTVTSDPSFVKNYDISEGNVSLTFGQPSGGTYSGIGVTGSTFNTTSAGNGTHQITYHFTDGATGCSGVDTVEITVSTTTSIAGVNEAVLQVSPNPFNGHLTVTTSQAASYEIVNGSGKLALAGILMEGVSTVNTETLAPGVYYLVLSSETRRSTVKMVKSK